MQPQTTSCDDPTSYETWIESAYDDEYDEPAYDELLWGRIEEELKIQGIYDAWIKRYERTN